MTQKLSHKTSAKINLFLNVVGKKDNGYHNLESIFAPISVFDVVSVSNSKSVTCAINSGQKIENNICLKVAHLLKEKFDIDEGCSIEIEKAIPISAGLGGGSSNAAATLLLLNKLWNLKLTYLQLTDIALQIGADVPFFLDPKPAFVSGVGEVIKPIKLARSIFILIINPNIEVSTQAVYKMGFAEFSKSIQSLNSLNELVLNGKNDLQNNAVKLCPEIKSCLDFLSSQGGCIVSRMSGSGATCFGIFKDEYSLNDAIKNVPMTWWKHHQLLEL